jgi:hypothetical protein
MASNNNRKPGLTVPAGILGPTQPLDDQEPERAEVAEEQGGDVGAEPPAPTEKPKGRSKPKGIRGSADKVDGRRIYLSEGVHFRLRIVAYQRGVSISQVAEEVLERGLPKFDVTRAG